MKELTQAKEKMAGIIEKIHDQGALLRAAREAGLSDEIDQVDLVHLFNIAEDLRGRMFDLVCQASTCLAEVGDRIEAEAGAVSAGKAVPVFKETVESIVSDLIAAAEKIEAAEEPNEIMRLKNSAIAAEKQQPAGNLRLLLDQLPS